MTDYNSPAQRPSGVSQPSSIESERAVLSSVLQDSKKLKQLDNLTEESFHFPAHGIIWRELLEMQREEKPIDYVTVQSWLESKGLLDQVGGPTYLAETYVFVATSANVEEYANIVSEKHRRRKVISICKETALAMSYEQESAANEVLAGTIQKLRPLLDHGNSAVPLVKEFMEGAADDIETFYRSRGAVIGVATGFTSVDKVLGGMKGGNMIVIAARPSMGKSALATGIAIHASKSGTPTAIFTLEMSARELAVRMACAEADIGLGKVRSGAMTSGDFRPLTNSISLIKDLPLFIEEKSAIETGEFRKKAKALKKRNDIGLIVIDYLQLMKSLSRKAQNSRQVEVSEISATIKEVAKDLNIPIIALCQLNREVEKRKDGKPILSDLRESGSLEQDADVVGLLWRVKQDDKEEASLLIAKNRSGISGVICPLWWDGETVQFKNLDNNQ